MEDRFSDTQLRTDWKGRKYKIVNGQYLYYTKKGKPKMFNQKEMKLM